MKAKYKSLLALALTAPLLTGCLEEAIPTDGVIQSQLNASESCRCNHHEYARIYEHPRHARCECGL